MGEVVDASYVLSLLLPDESAHDNVPEQMVAPHLLKIEVMNGLRSATVSKRIDAILAKELIAEFKNWDLQYLEIDLSQTLELAVNNNLSGYDASYLWVARKFGINLRTFDKKLLELTK